MKACVLCGSEPATVEMLVENIPRAAVALPGRLEIGPTCLSLFEHDADDALVARLSPGFVDFDPRSVIDLLRRSACGHSPLAPEHASIVRARESGFVPLAEHTGADLGPVWPEDHRIPRATLDGSAVDSDDRWLVRSPWPWLTVPDLLEALWQWVERDPLPRDEREQNARIAAFFALDEVEARAATRRTDR